MTETPFLGTAYTARSTNLADQSLINLFPTIVETKSGKAVGAFYMTPGLDSLVTCGTGPIRGVYPWAGKLWVVSGPTLYSVSSDYQTITNVYTMSTSSGPVTMLDNGSQMGVFDGTAGYYVAAGTGHTMSLQAAGPSYATQQDGYVLLTQAGTNVLWQSNLTDMSTWSALGFSSVAAQPDLIQAVIAVKREIRILKQYSTEFWTDSGLTNFAFARLDGVFSDQGCAAPYSAQIVGQQLLWLSSDKQGQGIVLAAEGYQPKRISTHAVEAAWAKYTTIADAISYTHQVEGHLFYVLTFPTGDETWVYDVISEAWHQRAAFSNGTFGRHWGNCCCQFNGLSVVGDYRNGNVYAFNMNTTTDAGTRRKWVRGWRALPKPVRAPVRFDALYVDMETGAQIDPGADPQVVLRWSDDGGHTWSPDVIGAAGTLGQTAKRVKFRRLGSTRRGHGLDRIFELSSTDAFKVALIGAEIEP